MESILDTTAVSRQSQACFTSKPEHVGGVTTYVKLLDAPIRARDGALRLGSFIRSLGIDKPS